MTPAREPRSSAVAGRRNSDREKEQGQPDGGELPADLEGLARLMDESIRLPGGYRIGLDGLVGLVPGIGDAVGAVVSLYLVGRAAKLGAPRSAVARMLGNVGLETLVGAVPIVGDAFDFAFKANRRNVRILRRWMEKESAGRGGAGVR
jgi:hypothetical protein